jgi:low temperature requirement protein LtrA
VVILVGYAWLSALVDPEQDVVRITVFAAMPALLVVSLAVPDAFEDEALLFAGALSVVAGRDHAHLPHSAAGWPATP